VCDTFCSVDADATLFAKNSDRPPDEVQVVELHPRRSAVSSARPMQYIEVADRPAHAVMLSRPTWLVGAEHGVNEHGVAVGNERVYSLVEDRAPALLGMDLVRLVLERAATADEGLAVLTGLLAGHGQGGSGVADHDDPYDSSFLVVDPQGGWVIETSGSDWVAQRVVGSAAISNRYGIGMAGDRAGGRASTATDTTAWHDPSVDTRIADHRLAATTRCATARPTVADAVAVLRDHGGSAEPPSRVGPDRSGVTVCMHIRDFQATTASMVATLGAGDTPIRTWVCLGSPCVGVYLPVRFGAVPAGLSDPSRWHRAAGRRRQVEADGAALAPLRQVLDPLEVELWQEADVAHAATDDPAVHLALAERSLARIDAATG